MRHPAAHTVLVHGNPDNSGIAVVPEPSLIALMTPVGIDCPEQWRREIAALEVYRAMLPDAL